MSEEAKHPGCPLEPVHKRLEDLHRQWHAAADAYFDPEAFRVAIQTAIQTSRTVSFILQSNKRVFPDFDAWYGPWQQKFKDDPLMRWMVEARNKIEKQGDLEARSVVRAEIVASYLNDEVKRVEVPAALWDAPLQLVKNIPQNDLGEHIRKQGIVRIQRRWVENSLPDCELLDAVATTHGRLSQLLSNAHKTLGLREPETTNTETGQVYGDELREGRLPCMIGHSDLRTLDVWLADGRPVELVSTHETIDRAQAEKAAKRYGTDPSKAFAGGDIETIFKNMFEHQARKVFLNDGYHRNIVMLFKGKKLVDLRELRIDEHGQKYLMMRKLADEVIKHGADAAIMISEVWRSVYDPQHKYRRSVDAPDRKEALTATLARSAGDPIELMAEIEREGDVVSLGETVEHRGGAHFMFAPLYVAWGREIPGEWVEAFKAADRRQKNEET